jgi:NAD+ kinase
MSSVLLVVRPEREEATELASRARQWWLAHGYDVQIYQESSGPVEADLAISLGGDGTMLRTVQLTVARGIPVLGVNLGRMGYLTEVDPGVATTAFERILAGDYRLDERMMLEVETRRHRDGPALSRELALNEVIVEKNVPGHTIDVEVGLSGQRFLTYVADGLIACSPTGSTAYNLSARGPVVSPSLDAIVLTPIAPHAVFDRSLVLGPSEWLDITLLEPRNASVVLDGSAITPISPGTTVRVRVARERARFVTFGEASFHSVLRSRFSLTDR